MDRFHFNTFLVVSLGVTLFNIISTLCFNYKNVSKIIPCENHLHLKSVKTEIVYIIAFFLFLVCIWEYRQKIEITNASSISNALYELDFDYKFGNRSSAQLPILLRNLILIRTVVCLYFSYLLAKMFALKKFCSNFYAVLIVWCIGIIGAFLSGSRGNAVTILLFSIFVWSVIKTLSSPAFRVMNMKKAITFCLISVMSLSLFVKSTEWVGRSLYSWSSEYYLAIYCGAEIKNLDIYINEKQSERDYFGQYTLGKFYAEIIKSKMNRDESLDHVQFREVKGHLLGNVYTAFQNYYADLGYWGVFLFVGIMAVITNYLFINSLNKKVLYKRFDFVLFMYAYLSTTVAYSFFHERFYNTISWYTVKMLIELYIINTILKRYTIKLL